MREVRRTSLHSQHEKCFEEVKRREALVRCSDGLCAVTFHIEYTGVLIIIFPSILTVYLLYGNQAIISSINVQQYLIKVYIILKYQKYVFSESDIMGEPSAGIQ
jgi:hypothetical protein